MDEIIERLRYLFNLPTLAGVEEIAAELDKLRDLLAAPETATMRQALALPDDAAFPQILTGLADSDVFSAAMRSMPVLDDYVPKAEYERLLSEHQRVISETEAAQKAAEDKRVTDAVEAAIAAHKIAPASREWATDHARKDPDGFARFVASAPVILGDAHRGKLPGTPSPEPVRNPLLADAERRAGK